MIRTKDLTKRYGESIAVDALNLHVQPGEIYGLLGPKGAGKTTTLLMLLGILPPTSGSIFLFDFPLIPDHYFAIKRRIGVVGERPCFYDDMTARENLHFFAKLYAVRNTEERIERLMEALNLSGFLDVRLSDYAQNMKQKLAFVRALLPDPNLLVLDEPISGLDPCSIGAVRQLVEVQNQAGKTVLIFSCTLSDLECTAHRVGIVHHGRLLAQDTVAGLWARLASEQQIELELAEPKPNLPTALAQLPSVRGVEGLEGGEGRRFTVYLSGGPDARAGLSRAVTGQGGTIVAMQHRARHQEGVAVTITEGDIPRLTGQGTVRVTT
ncbi:MAG: ABC transporter ATP-binding protein [Anaerolineae bacterium]|nr:MAG: ABC transporter ATP-binding protein [Anaerolineae bacterium]